MDASLCQDGTAAPGASHSRRSSFHRVQAAQSRPTSADHIITIESFNQRGGGHTYRSSVASSPGQTPVVLAPDGVPAAAALSTVTAGQLVSDALSTAAEIPSSHSNTSRLPSNLDHDLRTPLLPGSDKRPGSASYAAGDHAAYAAAPVGPQQDTQQQVVDILDTSNGQHYSVILPVLTPEQIAKQKRFQRQLSFAYGLSWVVNVLLLVAKLYAYYVSQSKAVLASAADSAVDLVSQIVIAYADWKMKQQDPRFPVGKARLEAIGVLACACIMSVASFEVVSESLEVLFTAWQTGELPQLELGLVMYLVLGSATVLKLLCWVVCGALASRSDSMVALAEDHLNDILSNMCAIITAVLAGLVPNGWWIDPVGAIAISLYIVVRWLDIAKQQVDKIVGRGAPAVFIQQLEELANTHHEAMGLDVIRAYHFGARYIVEMEVVLPAHMSVQDSHDISLDLQHKVEQFDEVERAFVHVDYMRRDGLEHKVERELAGRSTSTGSGGRLDVASPDGGQGQEV